MSHQNTATVPALRTITDASRLPCDHCGHPYIQLSLDCGHSQVYRFSPVDAPAEGQQVVCSRCPRVSIAEVMAEVEAAYERCRPMLEETR